MKLFCSLLLLSCLCFSASSIALAFCSTGSIQLYPKQLAISQNSLFIIEGYGEAQQIVTGLNKDYKVYLKAGNAVVNLNVKELFYGNDRLVQAIVQPERILQQGLSYTLHIDSIDKLKPIGYGTPFFKRFIPVTYSVVKNMDTVSPSVGIYPKVIDNVYMTFGCGPDIYVEFSLPSVDDSTIFIKTTVKCISTGVSTTYCLFPSRNKIIVGRNMCAGAFTFDSGNDFEATFSFIDFSGNRARVDEKYVAFSKPTHKE